MATNNVPRIMLASVMSGGGKTTAVCGLLRALSERGIKTASFKCGPDYIDPMYHRAASGRCGINLDIYFYGKDGIKGLFSEKSKGADIAVAEGVMGYYDGMSMENADASSYDVAAALDMPVVLVLNAKGMAYTAVSVIKAVKEFRNDSRIRAVILNNVTGMTFSMLKPVIERETGVKAIGYIPKMEHELKSRHLGLELPFENKGTEAVISKAAGIMAKTVDIDELLRTASSAGTINYEKRIVRNRGSVRIAVAYDRAFCFYYKDNIELMEKSGAEIEYFSPLYDESLPDGVSGIILGGGYPELYAKKLSGNKAMLRDIKNKISKGMPCLAECGGFMYLHDDIEGADGTIYPMAGVFKASAFRTEKLVRFGYAELTADKDNAFLKIGTKIRGHEFHYWDSTGAGDCCTAVKPSGKRSWSCMHGSGNVFAGFPHLCYGSNPEFIESFIKKCMEYEND